MKHNQATECGVEFKLSPPRRLEGMFAICWTAKSVDKSCPPLPDGDVNVRQARCRSLAIKKGRRLAVVNAPIGLDTTIGALDSRADPAEAEVVLLFTANRVRFDANLPIILKAARANAILWIAYPKLISKLVGGPSRDIIHDLVPGQGLDTVSQIAIDANWSALPSAADAFYEWKAVPDGEQPYAIARTEECPSGLCRVVGKLARPGRRGAAQLHYRHYGRERGHGPAARAYPVILEPAAWPVWLGEDAGNYAALLQPAAVRVFAFASRPYANGFPPRMPSHALKQLGIFAVGTHRCSSAITPYSKPCRQGRHRAPG